MKRKNEERMKKKTKAYYVAFGTSGTVGTVYATSLESAKRKARGKMSVHARPKRPEYAR